MVESEYQGNSHFYHPRQPPFSSKMSFYFITVEGEANYGATYYEKNGCRTGFRSSCSPEELWVLADRGYSDFTVDSEDECEVQKLRITAYEFEGCFRQYLDTDHIEACIGKEVHLYYCGTERIKILEENDEWLPEKYRKKQNDSGSGPGPSREQI